MLLIRILVNFIVCYIHVSGKAVNNVESCTSKVEYVAVQNTHLKLICSCPECSGLHWTYERSKESIAIISTDYSATSKISLDILNVTYADTGIYTCWNRTGGIVADFFIYAPEGKHPFTTDHDHFTLNCQTGADFLVPCVPTDPKSKVSLMYGQNHNYTVDKDVFNSKPDFIPMIGFLLKKVQKCPRIRLKCFLDTSYKHIDVFVFNGLSHVLYHPHDTTRIPDTFVRTLEVHDLQLGSVTKYCSVQEVETTKNSSSIFPVYMPLTIIAAVMASILLAILLVLIIVCWPKNKRCLMNKNKTKRKELEYEEMKPLDEKCEEIQTEQLEIGELIGSGYFGEVRKATLQVPGAENRAVAVKVAKWNSKEKEDILRKEIAVMSNIDYHINILNLIGACTQRKEFYLITEYCKYGNLKTYLQSQRGTFQSMMTANKNDIDYELCSSLSATYILLQQILRNALTGTKDSFEGTALIEEEESVTSLDLVSWAYQICSGMVFLSSRRVIHRDLACRNILLCERKLVKICDFGLAKNMERLKKDYYRSQEQAPLPMKWVAVESLESGKFTMDSDIWSYGVVLWELFSLGKEPYEGVSVDSQFYKKLRDGTLRLTRPMEQPDFVHSVMDACLNVYPRERPPFQRINQIFQQELLKRIQLHIVEVHRKQPDLLSDSVESGSFVPSALRQESERLTAHSHNEKMTHTL